MDPRLVRLCEAARLASERDLAALTAARDRREALEAEIADLRRPLRPGDEAAMAFLLSGGGDRFDAWRTAEIGRLNGALAAVRAEELALRGVASRSRARSEVLDRLAAKSARGG